MAHPSHTTVPDLAVPARCGRVAAPAGFHGSRVLAGLDVLSGRYGHAGRCIALAGIAALAALIRRHTGMALGAVLSLVAVVGLVGLAWVVFALRALVAAGDLLFLDDDIRCGRLWPSGRRFWRRDTL